MGTVSIMFTIALIIGTTPADIETRTLIDVDEKGKATSYIFNQRILTANGFTLVTKSLQPDSGDVSYSRQDFAMSGEPRKFSQEGFWNDRWNVFETVFKKDGAEQSINGEVTPSKLGAAKFKNPTLLWFWRTHPKVGESVTVDFLAQNTIITFKINFAYEGDEKVTLKGREVTLHRVREKPISAPDEVYTIWWYDDQGMGVKRYHKTTEHEYWYQLLSWR